MARGVDLRTPLDADAVRAIEAAIDRYGLLVWHNQPLDADRQIAFARDFGPLVTRYLTTGSSCRWCACVRARSPSCCVRAA